MITSRWKTLLPASLLHLIDHHELESHTGLRASCAALDTYINASARPETDSWNEPFDYRGDIMPCDSLLLGALVPSSAATFGARQDVHSYSAEYMVA